jgi:hypothetical protein
VSFNDYGYDPKIGRRWGIDPEHRIYISPYAVFANNPLMFKDKNGEDIVDGSKLFEYFDVLNQVADELERISNKIDAYGKAVDDAMAAQDQYHQGQSIVDKIARGPGQVITSIIDYFTDDHLTDKIEGYKEGLQSSINEYEELASSYGVINEEVQKALLNKNGIALPDHDTGEINLYNLISISDEATANSSIHKNSDKYKGPQSVYEIKINGKVYKYGKADGKNLTKGDNGKPVPRRLQSQLEKLRRDHPRSFVRGKEVYKSKSITTKKIKQIETKKIVDYKEKYGQGKYIPYGNKGHKKLGKPKK